MKEIKNYTTRDWARQMCLMMCYMALLMACFRCAMAGKWLYAAGFLLGAIGWSILYIIDRRKIEEKNK